jgi:F-type H+-transporting ATPase subunit b
MHILALVGEAARETIVFTQEGGGEEPHVESAPFQINIFWIVVAATTFVFFFFLIRAFAFSGIAKTLEERRARIEQGLKDAEQAAKDRAAAEEERIKALQEARREANDILTRAQKVSDETREADLKATREEVERIRQRATADIEAEKQKAITELRSEVADLALAAASKVVGESLDDTRQRRLVQEFLEESGGKRGGSKG